MQHTVHLLQRKFLQSRNGQLQSWRATVMQSWALSLNIYQVIQSRFILGGLNYYVLTSTKKKYNVLIVFMLYCKTLLLLLRWDTGKVRDRFGGMGRFKGGFRCKEWVNSVIINVIAEIN